MIIARSNKNLGHELMLMLKTDVLACGHRSVSNAVADSTMIQMKYLPVKKNKVKYESIILVIFMNLKDKKKRDKNLTKT